jgi:hypothetical protein
MKLSVCDVKVVGKAFMSAVRQEIRLSQEAAKRHAESRGTAHAAESLRYQCCGSGSTRIRIIFVTWIRFK